MTSASPWESRTFVLIEERLRDPPVERRVDIRYIQELFGHNHIQTTAQYLKVDVRDLKEVFTQAHPRQKRRQAKKARSR